MAIQTRKENSVSSTPTEQDETRSRLSRSTPANSAAAPETQSNNAFSRVRRWFAGIIAEIRKVTWPTRTETRNLTIVVIGISVTVGAILGLVDTILAAVTRALTGA